MLRARPANWVVDDADFPRWKDDSRSARVGALASAGIREWSIYMSNHEAFAEPLPNQAEGSFFA
eukprot:10299962-Prorocentrum_lima.AAC.1